MNANLFMNNQFSFDMGGFGQIRHNICNIVSNKSLKASRPKKKPCIF